MLITILGVGAAFLSCATLACVAFRTQPDRDMVRSLRGEPCEFPEPEPEELYRGSFVYDDEPTGEYTQDELNEFQRMLFEADAEYSSAP